MLRGLDKALWRSVEGPSAALVMDHERSDKPCAFYPNAISDPQVRTRMEECSTWTQEEYINTLRGDLWVDASTGFVLLPGFLYLEASVPYAYQAAKPSALGFLAARSGFRRVLEFDRVISFRDVHEHNYFHFFNDVLTKIPLLENAGLLDAPLLIGTRLYHQPFFQAVIHSLTKAGLQLVDQGNHHVRANEVVYCKSMPYSRAYFDRVLDILEVPHANERTGSKKVFLVRGSAHTAKRLISNMAEVAGVAEALGFSIHDPGKLMLNKQMDLLSNTRHLVTIHGAGATNMIFRRGAPLEVLELFPAESIPPHYYALAGGMGHGYDGMVCDASGANGQFNVPLDQYRTALQRLIAEP